MLIKSPPSLSLPVKNSHLNTPLPDLRSIIESYQSSQIASRLSSLHLTQTNNNLVRDGLVLPEDPSKAKAKAMKAKIPESFRLKEVVKTIEGVSAVNLLGVWVERLASRRFDTSSARSVITNKLHLKIVC